MRWLLLLVLAACSFEHGRVSPTRNDAALIDGSGSMSSDGASAATDAAVDGPLPPPSGVTCPGSMCGAVCCVGICGAFICQGTVYECDGPEDCSGSEVCCNDQNGSFCTTSACNGNGRFEVCHTTSDCSFSCGDCSFRNDYGQKVCCE